MNLRVQLAVERRPLSRRGWRHIHQADAINGDIVRRGANDEYRFATGHVGRIGERDVLPTKIKSFPGGVRPVLDLYDSPEIDGQRARAGWHGAFEPVPGTTGTSGGARIAAADHLALTTGIGGPRHGAGLDSAGECIGTAHVNRLIVDIRMEVSRRILGCPALYGSYRRGQCRRKDDGNIGTRIQRLQRVVGCLNGRSQRTCASKGAPQRADTGGWCRCIGIGSVAVVGDREDDGRRQCRG